MIAPSAAHTTTPSPIARMTALSSAALACSAWARRWRRTWTSIRSLMSRATATIPRRPPGRSTGRRTTSPVVVRPSAPGNSTRTVAASRSPVASGRIRPVSLTASAGATSASTRRPSSASRDCPKRSQAPRLTSSMTRDSGSNTRIASRTVSRINRKRSASRWTSAVSPEIAGVVPWISCALGPDGLSPTPALGSTVRPVVIDPGTAPR